MFSRSFFPHWRRKAEERSNRLSNSYEVPLFVNAVYYPNWRIYRNRKQPPSSFRLGFISHVFYAFAWVKEDGTVFLSDEYADSEIPVDGTTGCLRAFTQLKSQYSKMKIILSVGGGGKGSENFAAVAENPSYRETFVQTAKGLVDHFGLDGIDVDWEHPSDPSQGEDYVLLLARLRQVLPSPRYVLATCLPAGQWALQNIDLSQVQNYVDLINIMAYDFSGPWSDKTGHQSQLSGPMSCQSAISYFVSQGVDPKKLILGVPVYGRSFLGSSNIGQTYTGCGGEDGVFDYCDLPRPGAKEYYDEQAGAAWCSGGDGGFVTYDTPKTVYQKAKFVTETRLGGLFYWHIGGDAKEGGDAKTRSLIKTGYETLHDMN